QDLHVTEKPDLTPVSDADTSVEKAIRATLARTRPRDAVLGEEFGATAAAAGSGKRQWVIDPIDGTKSFISGFPTWGTLIALLHKGTPVFGMMHQPFIGERFSGDNGSASYKGPSGERRLAVRRCPSLKDATLFTTSPLLMNDSDRAIFEKVQAESRLTRFGGDCYAYCMLAAGQLDLVIETELKPYDIAALIPIVTGAGGIVTTWDGKPAQSGGRIIAAGDKRVHEAALKILNA
uniref:histidinol-phosphatase n=1 Tax=Rhodopseudomonas sp. TaxID=1078 RepID=UPI003B3A74FB